MRASCSSLNAPSGTLRHGRFGDLVNMIPAGDVLALNTTRVIRARLLGTRDSPTGAPAEVLVLKPLGDAIAARSKRSCTRAESCGRVAAFTSPTDLSVEILSVTDRRTRIVRLDTPLAPDAALARHGHVPLPPYITRGDTATDADRYQTVYATEPGSIAAPTAGLHFTPELLAQLAARGVRRADVLLHVGAGTFKPVEADDPADHPMHEEWFSIDSAAADAVNTAHSQGRQCGQSGRRRCARSRRRPTNAGRCEPQPGKRACL